MGCRALRAFPSSREKGSQPESAKLIIWVDHRENHEQRRELTQEHLGLRLLHRVVRLSLIHI